MKKSILISLVVIFAYGNAVACDIFNGPYSSPSYYGCNNGSIEVTTDFNLISGNFFILYRYGNPVSNWIEVPDNSSFTWHDLAPGDYVVYFQEKIGGNIWCSESRGVNVPDVSLTYSFNAYSINATTPSCSNAQISGGGNYVVNGTATAFNLTKNLTYYYSLNTSYNFQFSNIETGYYLVNVYGNLPGTCQIINSNSYLTVGSASNCNISMDAFPSAGCADGGGSILVVTNANGQPVHHYSTEIFKNNALVASANYAATEYNFTNLNSGDYTVVTKTYPENNSTCFCENSKNVTIGPPSSLFYNSQITTINPVKHFCGDDGKIFVTVPNYYNPSFLGYWPHPYMSYFNFYLYDVNWNQLQNKTGYTGCEFNGLVAGNYNVLVIGSRFDAMFCYVPQISLATLSDPPCNMNITVTNDGIPQNCFKDISGVLQNFCQPGLVYLYKSGETTPIDSFASSSGGQFAMKVNENGNYYASTTDVLSGCSATTALTVNEVVCPVPQNIGYVQLSNKKVKILWDDIDCASGYNVQLRIKGSTNWNTYYINEANGAFKIFGNLFQGVTYEFRVRTKCSANTTSVYSQKYSFCLNNTSKESIIVGNDVLNVIPNPAKEFADIYINNFDEENAQMVIYDLLGNIKYKEQLSSQTIQLRIDLSTFADGIYLIQVTGPAIASTKRFIVAK